MGYFKDQHLIIVSSDEEPLKELRTKAVELLHEKLPDADYGSYLPPVLHGLANFLEVLFIPADGSKEGWETSNEMDDIRQELIRHAIYINAQGKYRVEVIEVVDDEIDGLSVAKVVGS